jgi:hypothetical protein
MRTRPSGPSNFADLLREAGVSTRRPRPVGFGPRPGSAPAAEPALEPAAPARPEPLSSAGAPSPAGPPERARAPGSFADLLREAGVSTRRAPARGFGGPTTAPTTATTAAVVVGASPGPASAVALGAAGGVSPAPVAGASAGRRADVGALLDTAVKAERRLWAAVAALEARLESAPRSVASAAARGRLARLRAEIGPQIDALIDPRASVRRDARKALEAVRRELSAAGEALATPTPAGSDVGGLLAFRAALAARLG